MVGMLYAAIALAGYLAFPTSALSNILLNFPASDPIMQAWGARKRKEGEGQEGRSICLRECLPIPSFPRRLMPPFSVGLEAQR